jgi:hypothetical protein
MVTRGNIGMVAACQYALDRGAVATQFWPVTLNIEPPMREVLLRPEAV